MSDLPSSIDRSISIDSPAGTVWRIVSVPGWWINNGSLTEHEIRDEGDGLSLVVDDELGEFRIETVQLDEPGYAAFRWHPTDREDPSTLTEFWIEEREGGVTLRVRESDFDELPADRLPGFLADNTAGWDTELALVRAAAEGR